MSLWGWLNFLPAAYQGDAIRGAFDAAGAVLAAVCGVILGAVVKGRFDRKQRLNLTEKNEQLVGETSSLIAQLHTLQAQKDSLSSECDSLRKESDRLLYEIEERKKNVDKIVEPLLNDNKTLWAAFEKKPPPGFGSLIYNSPPIITIANFKGGVGKTTLSAHLAAHFDEAGRRVLLIDMDYQGSLSVIVGKSRGDRSTVNELLSESSDFPTLMTLVQPLGPALAHSALVPSFYDLLHHEEQILFSWLMRRSVDDIRYRLARALLSPQLKTQFDLVIIDAPPRLTAGLVNALCASSHVLVPSVFDRLSAETVGNFLRVIKDLFVADLNPHLQVLGIVETLTPPSGQGKEERDAASSLITQDLKSIFPHTKIFSSHIPRRPAIPREYPPRDVQVKHLFATLAAEISQRI